MASSFYCKDFYFALYGGLSVFSVLHGEPCRALGFKCLGHQVSLPTGSELSARSCTHWPAEPKASSILVTTYLSIIKCLQLQLLNLGDTYSNQDLEDKKFI